MVKYVSSSDTDFQPSSVTTYSLDNPWWKVKGLDPDKMNWGRPLILEFWYTVSPEARSRMYPPTFTIHSKPRYYANKTIFDGEEKIYPSFIQTYLEHADPTEYIFAMSVFNSWEVWQKLTQNNYLQELIGTARSQLELRLKALSIRKNLELAEAGHQKAAEWAIKGGWDTDKPEKTTRGRKSKYQLEAEAKNQVDDLADAMTRVSPFLKVVNN